MTASDYRQARYRVERRTRPLSTEERALVTKRRETFLSARREAEKSTQAFELIGPCVVALGTAIFGIVRHVTVVAGFGVALLVFFTTLAVIATRRSRRELRTLESPWDLPADGDCPIEATRIVARSLVVAVSDDEDYAIRLLFEVPGSDWYFVDLYALPDNVWENLDQLARADVVIERVGVGGPVLAVKMTGDVIPRHGASGTAGDDYARDCERGHIWVPSSDETSAGCARSVEHGLVDPRKLPRWIHEATG